MLPKRDSFQGEKHKGTENVEMKKIFQAHGNRKWGMGWVATLISAKTDFKTKDIKEFREGHSVQFRHSVMSDSL